MLLLEIIDSELVNSIPVISGSVLPSISSATLQFSSSQSQVSGCMWKEGLEWKFVKVPDTIL